MITKNKFILKTLNVIEIFLINLFQKRENTKLYIIMFLKNEFIIKIFSMNLL